MPDEAIRQGDEILHIFDLTDPEVELDLSREPWNLKENQVSELVGMDVTRPGGMRPDRGRKNLGVSLPTADLPVINAESSELFGRDGVRYKDVFKFGGPALVEESDDACGWTASSSTITFPTTNIPNFRLGDAVSVYGVSPDTRFRGSYRVASRTSATDIVLLDPIAPSNLSNVRATYERYRGYSDRKHDSFTTHSSVLLIKNHFEYLATGPWPDAMVGGLITVNADSRSQDSNGKQNVQRTISSISTSVHPNDTINWGVDLKDAAGNVEGWALNDKFSIVYPDGFDKRGVWVTNGRKFWLFRGAAFTQYLDLGSDTYLGQRWSVSRIASNLAMFVNAKHPPRTVRLSSSASTAVSTDETLAGMLPPRKEPEIEVDTATNNGFTRAADAGGSLGAGVIKIKLRFVNLDESAESTFWDVASITATANQRVEVYHHDSTASPSPFTPAIHKRWTHLEIWRTVAGGSAYFLESRVEINDPKENELLGNDAKSNFVARAIPGNYPIKLSDTDLLALTAATSADQLAGGLPPICQKVVSLSGVTICLGAASASTTSASVDAYTSFVGDASYTAATKEITQAGYFQGYVVKTGDRFEIFDGGIDGASGLAVGQYVVSSTSGGNTVTLATSAGSLDATGVRGFLRRAITIKYPTIESDEDVWYSRTDKFAPESFPTRTLTLSRTGDTFRNAVNVGGSIAVIMDKGVHLIFWDGTQLLRRTVASDGVGTPWADSVIVIGPAVIWATPSGPRIMRASDSVNQDGSFGEIKDLDESGRMRNWFAESADNGYSIDSGVDVFNSCIRWRRKQDANTYQVAQLNYKTGKWTLLDDDNGVRYVRTSYAEATPAVAPYLYSITQDGAAFRVNYQGTDTAYPSATVQSKTIASDTVTPTFIERVAVFSASMVGEVVRFRSSNSAVDGQARVIRAATSDRITFDSLSGLARGDEFIIGANRFRVKSAPRYGGSKLNVKTLDSIHARVLPGPRGAAGSMALRAYRDFGTEAISSGSVPVFDESSIEKVSLDRTILVESDGTALEFTLECVEARTDFRVELIAAEVREQATYVEDASTAS